MADNKEENGRRMFALEKAIQVASMKQTEHRAGTVMGCGDAAAVVKDAETILEFLKKGDDSVKATIIRPVQA